MRQKHLDESPMTYLVDSLVNYRYFTEANDIDWEEAVSLSEEKWIQEVENIEKLGGILNDRE